MVPPGDADALAGAMQGLAAEPERAAAFGRAARARFDALYTGRAMGAAYGRLYRTLLAGRTAETATGTTTD